jgi:hypothetical protein
MKTNLKRATGVLLVIAGLTALNGSRALRLHADSQVSTNGISRRGCGAATTGLINTPAIPMRLRFRPCPSPRLSISPLMATANSPAPPLRITAALFFP